MSKEIKQEVLVEEKEVEMLPADKEAVIETPKLSKAEKEVKELQGKRMGSFIVKMSHAEATYFRNTLDRAEWKGPQQAYLLLISKSEIGGIVTRLANSPSKNDQADVELTSAVIESLSFFLNNKVGKGAESAQKLFAASMLLRPAITEINEIDSKLQEVTKKNSDK